ncbi:histidinol dehydrogenase [Halarsenatibacter silvermanii]|uniref:Histidinol dehydrogenase n=2 Tax=Halarsenatibacter silvermanii TaxID=321763 RepID=A0A1G9NFX4_9FIRM|nr:histidinol dehydrogenase [Halarsenatibacter silvermanii]
MIMKKLRYPQDEGEIRNYLEERKFNFDTGLNKKVSDIIDQVQTGGDKALFSLTRKYDGAELESLRVSADELEGEEEISEKLKKSLERAYQRLQKYYALQGRAGWIHPELSGRVGEEITPLKRAGLYIPGGKAAYPSSVMMTAVPASIAGVDKLVAVTPPDQEGNINPVTAKALSMCGVDEVYRIGGAQAVAALALGTETINPVDKIVGPGNKFVTMAKKLLYGFVDIDMLAGPSEVLIIADEASRAEFIAADMLAQAEHDEEARTAVISSSADVFAAVEEELEDQLAEISTASRARAALDDYGMFIEVENLDQAVELSNDYAPEHLEIQTENPHALLGSIEQAGSIFLGSWTPEAAGDYIAGPNHVLPTSGSARFFSPLGVNDFIKSSGRVSFSRSELEEIGEDVIRIADAEGLPAHARSVSLRLMGGE